MPPDTHTEARSSFSSSPSSSSAWLHVAVGGKSSLFTHELRRFRRS